MPQITSQDMQVAADIGEIKGSIKEIREGNKAIERRLDTLPCMKHGERLAKVETRSAFFGMIGGVVVTIGAKLLFWK